MPTPGPQFESRLGLTIINRIGAITLAIGIVFFFKYAVDNKWIGAAGRVILGLLAGLVLIGVADWLRKHDQRVFSQGVCGCGLAILYISLYAAFAYYELVPQAGAFLAMAGACALAVVLSFRYDHPAIAALGLIGGFLTPPLLHTKEDHPWLLFPYLLLLDVPSILIALRLEWYVLHALAFAGTAILYLVWASPAGPGKIGVGLLFLCIFIALFFAASLRSLRERIRPVPIVLLPLTAFWGIISGLVLFREQHLGWSAVFVFLLGVVYLGAAYGFQHGQQLFGTLYVTGHACFLLAGIRALEAWARNNVIPANQTSFLSETGSVFFAVYALVLISLGIARDSTVNRVFGLVLIGIVIAKLYLHDVWLLTRFYRISAFIALGILMLAASYIYSRMKKESES